MGQFPIIIYKSKGYSQVLVKIVNIYNNVMWAGDKKFPFEIVFTAWAIIHEKM